MKLKTKNVQLGRDKIRDRGAVNPGIYRTSSVLFDTLKEYHEADRYQGSPYIDVESHTVADPSYGISGTPTNYALANALCELESGDDCLLTPSGLSAITLTLLSLATPGSHILVVDSVYGPTRRFCHSVLRNHGVEIDYIPPTIGEDIEGYIKDNTKLIYLESPGSYTFEVQDIPAITAIAKEKGIITAIDNSWSSGVYYNPLEHGVDVVIHALTKFITGHADVVMGCVITKGEVIEPIVKMYRNLGLHVTADNAYMGLRGLRSLSQRLDAHEASAYKVLEYLKTETKVTNILCPAVEGNPNYERWKRDFTGLTSLFSVVLDKKYTIDELSEFTDKMKVFNIGCSWGGFESLVLDVDLKALRTAEKWQRDETVLRFFIGLEDVDDLVADLEAAFKRLP